MFVQDPRWRQFVADHAPRYEETVFLPALVPAPSAFTERIAAAVTSATTSGAKGLRLRGFRGSEFDFKLTERLSRTPPTDGQSLTEWLSGAADGRRACVAINDMSSWDLCLAALAQSMVRSLVPDRDLVSGADIYTFIADVEWTPFGIHKDDEPSLIFHLGPGLKELWVWPAGGIGQDQLFENPSLGRVSFDFDRLLPGARRYTLRPGDFVCIPQGRYHLFRNAGPSVFLGVTLFPPDVRKSFSGLLLDHFGARLDAADEPRSFDDVRRLVVDTLHDPGALAALSETIDVAAAKQRTAGYLRAPKAAALRIGAPPADATLAWAYTGVVECVAGADRTHLVARGREIVFGGAVNLDELLALDGEFTLRDLDAVLAPQLDDEDRRRHVVNALWRLGALSLGRAPSSALPTTRAACAASA
ncbi:cupin domain-containing protein [Mycobacteroides abscessus]